MSLTAIFEMLQALLLDPTPDHGTFRREAGQHRARLSPLDQARAEPAIRLSQALQDLDEDRAGAADVAALLRQCCRTGGTHLRIAALLRQRIAQQCPDHGLLPLGDGEPGAIDLVAADWGAGWLAHTGQIDHLDLRLPPDRTAPGDGLLYALSHTRWINYQSEAQQAAVHSFLFAPPGSTNLATLPTGAGKSLIAQLPAWAESRGGSVPGGVTLVIVPTIALALDQQRRAAALFPKARGPEWSPQCLTSASERATREAVRRGLLRGTLPMLFLSPETLMGSELYNVVLEAARANKIKRLVIDEAHLVERWGAGFRTDFQLLAAYRRQLLEASGGELRTLLLSATISHAAEELLEQLFARPERLDIVHGGRLRPEIGYWMNKSPSPSERRRRVIEALHYLPRPLILYATMPEDAERWLKSVQAAGYRRAASFTGETDSTERSRLIAAWGDGRIDIMCATSAFGLGIDKRDVRAVVHACLPENIDRFYQEVGRAGRDGCGAASLLLVADTDIAVMERRITEERALPRWQGMLASASMPDGRSAILDLDLDATPPDKPSMERSDRNRDWNEHTLLLAQRAGIITVLESRREPDDLPQPDSTGRASRRVRVQIERFDVAHDDKRFSDAIEQIRQEELGRSRADLEYMQALIAENTVSPPAQCIAQPLSRLYPDTALACGGCPACRHQGLDPYAKPLPLVVERQRRALLDSDLNSDLRALLGHTSTLHLRYNLPLHDMVLREALLRLVGKGVQQIILPAAYLERREFIEPLLRGLSAPARIVPHRLIASEQLLAQPEETLYPLPTATLYPTDERAADALHNALRRWLSPEIGQVIIVPRGLYLPSEHGYLDQRVGGLERDLSDLPDLLPADDDLF